jgi:hypothetical protein
MTQPGRILLSDTGGPAKPSGALPRQANGVENWRKSGECVRRANVNYLAQRHSLEWINPCQWQKFVFPEDPIILGIPLVSGDLVSPWPILHFGFFHEADRSSLEGNVLIRIGGGEDSYGLFISGETFEKCAILGPRRWVGFVGRFSECNLVLIRTPGCHLRDAL